MAQPLSIDQRKFDWFYVVVLCIFSLFSFFGDSTPATGGPDPHSGWIMKRLIHDIYAMNKDPLVLYSPVFVRVACFFAAFIFGPFQLVAAWAIWKGKHWIRTPMLVYAGALFEGSFIFEWAEWFGDKAFFERVCGAGSTFDFAQQNALWVQSFNLPYIVVPLMLIVRFWPERPFEPKNKALAN